LVSGGADASRGFAHASTPSYGHGHSHGGDAAEAEKITVTFIEKDGTETVVQVGGRGFLFVKGVFFFAPGKGTGL
jgi:hypothetical protein